MITDRIGLPSVLLPLLILIYSEWRDSENQQFHLGHVHITGEVSFHLIGTNSFMKGARVDVINSNMKISRGRLADYVSKCTKERTARAARFCFLVQPIK